jgi:hypothetical protein
MESYDFIMSTGPTGKPGLSKKMRIIVVAGLAVLLIFGALFVNTLLTSGSKENAQTLLTIAQRQTELVRVASLGVTEARSSTAQNLAQTTKLSIQSDHLSLLNTLKSSDIKINTKLLGGRKDSKTDKLFTQAQQANSFDEVFIKTLQTQLIDYRKDLKQAYDNAKTTKLKQTLSTQYTHASNLLPKDTTP